MSYEKYNDMLLPCPFCGGKAELQDPCDCDDAYLVMCDECYASAGIAYSEAECVERWNTRIGCNELAAAVSDISALAHTMGALDELRAIVARLDGITGDSE